jgi:hypothetical protein
LLQARSSDPAFHPYGGQRVLFLGDGLFSLVRTNPDGQSQVLCLHNVTADEFQVQVQSESVGLEPGVWRDMLTSEELRVGPEATNIWVPAYGVRWLKV